MEKLNRTIRNPLEQTLLLESKIGELMTQIATKIISRVKSFKLMSDDDFVKRRDRTTNDIHLFFELNNGQYFHLRAYTRHMIETGNTSGDQIFLTGYLKQSIKHTGGVHSFRQDWYQWNSETIANELIDQNKNLF